ncbi:hypothetical protein JAAARDRAFT_195137 [Jaapia argillacea MUCL 33604]|uniref:Uncharacterized protein n=1 Tax=Jaapia argillacea MUCL 33604 TaxID=933084 RepID=A0A067PZX0_9AGAM|nr:hypothetical protein JAAARDRAFT_195137 [Jaapia argillacea MUCL 33604]
MPISLHSVIKTFELQDQFTVHPGCPSCHRIFQPTIPSSSHCPNCDLPLFTSKGTNIFQKLSGRRPPPPPLKFAVPIAPLSSLLADFFAEGEMESSVDEWQQTPHEPGQYTSPMDGTVPCEVKSHNGSLFFDKASLEEENEIRLVVTFSLDWFNVNNSAFASSHSTGVMLFCISNLRPELRYQTKNLLMPIVLPGPSEPMTEQLQNYLKIIVDDLIKLYEEGVRVKTPTCPEGRCQATQWSLA